MTKVKQQGLRLSLETMETYLLVQYVLHLAISETNSRFEGPNLQLG